jgi:alanine racemase
MHSWIEIDTCAFGDNVSTVRKLIGSDIAIGIVLKGNAYGHGLIEMAILAEHNSHITWLLVATLEEALVLRKVGCTKEILVLALINPELIQDALRANIVISVVNRSIAEALVREGRLANICPRVHLKVDMGMNRLGLFPEEVYEVVHAFPQLKIEGIFSHIGTTNIADTQTLNNTVSSFNQWCKLFDPKRQWMWHIGASGLLWSTQLQDMVRVGTMLYGSWKSEINRSRSIEKVSRDIIPLMRWKTTVVQIKRVLEGSYIGYDQMFRAIKPMRIAILPVGYADGYPRNFSQKGVVWICGYYAPVLGLISMNLTVIDVSEIPEAVEGSEVVLIGQYEKITPYALATITGTNPNDLTSGIIAGIKRIVIDEVVNDPI